MDQVREQRGKLRGGAVVAGPVRGGDVASCVGLLSSIVGADGVY